MYFRAIDGLRAYLAWIVVAAHVTWYTGLTERTPALGIINRLADNAVTLFIIISGFVITHLLLTRREGYLLYLDRRILRLFPSYLVCLGFGTLTTFLYFDAFGGRPWGELTPHVQEMSDQIASLEGRGLFYHLLAHVWLLNGIVPDSILYQAQMMFLAPAWSLSLEWQFYLIAPLVVAAMAFAGGRIATCIVAGAAFVAYSKGWFGRFDHPSFLPGAAIFFAVGAVTRIAIDDLPKVRSYPLGLGVICLAATYNVEQLRPLVLWGAFVAWWSLQPQDGTSGWIKTVGSRALENGLVIELGKWSYATYLVHVPIIQFLIFVAVRYGHLGPRGTAVCVIAMVVPLTLAASYLLHRYVEMPAIAFGKRLSRSEARKPEGTLELQQSPSRAMS